MQTLGNRAPSGVSTLPDERYADFEIPIPDQFPAWGLEGLNWTPPRGFMLSPRPNGFPGYWWWRDGPAKSDRERSASASSDAFREGIRPFNLEPGDFRILNGEDSCSERSVKYDWPRVLRWRELPYIGAPRFGMGDSFGAKRPGSDWSELPGRFGAPIRRQISLACLARPEVAILNHPEPGTETLADFGRLLALGAASGMKLGRNKAPLLLWFDGVRMRPLDPALIAEAEREWSAHDRFVWNHILNARILVGRALTNAFALGGYNTSDRWVRRSLGAGFFLEQRWSPFTLQVLFHLARLGDCAVAPRYCTPRFGEWHKTERYHADLAVGSGLAEIEGALIRWTWRGTGNYPA
jgi:hypothetical protein